MSRIFLEECAQFFVFDRDSSPDVSGRAKCEHEGSQEEGRRRGDVSVLSFVLPITLFLGLCDTRCHINDNKRRVSCRPNERADMGQEGFNKNLRRTDWP